MVPETEQIGYPKTSAKKIPLYAPQYSKLAHISTALRWKPEINQASVIL
jgi:hypothetical protein